MVSITRELFPGVNDLARELRYRCFEQPFFESARDTCMQRWRSTWIISQLIRMRWICSKKCVLWSSVLSRSPACWLDDFPPRQLLCVRP